VAVGRLVHDGGALKVANFQKICFFGAT